MKKITLEELWDDHLPEIVSFPVDADTSKTADPYIQTLLALGHKVYIPVYKADHNLTVVVA